MPQKEKDIASEILRDFRGALFGLSKDDSVEISANNTFYIGKCLSRSQPLAKTKFLLLLDRIDPPSTEENKEDYFKTLKKRKTSLTEALLFPSLRALEGHVYKLLAEDHEEIFIENVIDHLGPRMYEVTFNPENLRISLPKDVRALIPGKDIELSGTKLYIKITVPIAAHEEGNQ